MKDILKILKEILSFLTSYFNYKSSKNDSRLISDLDKTKSEVDKAIYNNDDDYINKLLSKSLFILFSLSLLSFIGCQSVKYIPSDRQIKSIIYENVEGKFVPNSVFSELLKYKVEWDYYFQKYGPIK